MRFLLLAALAICLASSVKANQVPSSTTLPVRVDDPFPFVQALVDSFGDAREGLRRAENAAKDMGEVMFRAKQADREYARAAALMEPFTKSKDEAIKGCPCNLPYFSARHKY